MVSTSSISAADPSAGATASPRVAIVIVTHKECYPLDRCIESHARLLRSPSDLIFVDNGSGGRMSEWAKSQYPEITVITREINGFFCGGYNTGMQHAIDHDYDYVLIVNADTEVASPAYLDELVSAMDRHPKAAFIGPKVFIREVGNVQNTILIYPWFMRYLFGWVSSIVRRPNRSAEALQDQQVEFLNGVCVLCRVSALRQIGLLDEVMGGYVEDTDWSWRAKKLGWESYFLPVPSIVHHQPPDEYEHHSMKSFMLRRNHVYWHAKEGRWIQARLFAMASLLLARVRLMKAYWKKQNLAEHQNYISRFRDVTRRLLRHEPIGEWFGPPTGKW